MPMTLLEETRFWTNQFSEHLGFLGEMLQGELRQEAEARHSEYEQMRREAMLLESGEAMADAVEGPTRSLYAFQVELCEMLDAGEWLGFAWPLFCDHITREVELYMHLAYGDPPPPGGISAAVSQMGGEHALFAASLIDPASQAPSTIAREAGSKLIDMSAKEQTRIRIAGEIALQQTIRAFVETTGLGTPTGVKSLVSPILRDHVLREQTYYTDKLQDAIFSL